jgi:hypothetical protein
VTTVFQASEIISVTPGDIRGATAACPGFLVPLQYSKLTQERKGDPDLELDETIHELLNNNDIACSRHKAVPATKLAIH